MARTFSFACLPSAITAACLFIGGCQLWSGRRIGNPLSYRQQTLEIKKIVPVGTDRQETIRRLNEAGIEGEFSRVGRSIYYCHLWNRKDSNARWHLNVALLFDRDGLFYATQPSDSDATMMPSETSRTAADTSRDTSSTRGPAAGSASPFPSASSRNSNRQQTPQRRGDAHRRPFGDADDR